MTQNIIIACLLVLGIVAVVKGFRLGRKSSFDDGSFIFQMLLWAGGAICIGVALVWKFVLSFFS